MKVVCTGGLGYIGSHTVKYLCDAGHDVIVIDNLCNVPEEKPSRLERLRTICGKPQLKFIEIDLKNKPQLFQTLADESPDAVIHFAALKQVGESQEQPLEYYENNVGGLVNLLQAMKHAGCNRLLFSGSAAIYPPQEEPIKETVKANAASVYGKTKSMGEQIIEDLCSSTDKSSSFSAVTLRYFNPVGAEPSGMIGDNPSNPLNIFPIIQRTAAGMQKELTVFGNDWDTPDGTGVRDYIDVNDLAEAHVSGLAKLGKAKAGAHHIYNIGTGRGLSVLEIIKAFEKTSGKKVPVVFGPKRPGDIGKCVACPDLALKELDWKATRSLEESCVSAWNFMLKSAEKS